jgi:hypothetical protein
VAVSFQVVLVVGQSDEIAPINAAGALNVNCPACVTTAIADQIVVTLSRRPPAALRQRLEAALSKLDALPRLGAAGSPAAVAAQVSTVQQQVETILNDSKLLTAGTVGGTQSATSTAAAGGTTGPATSSAGPVTGSPATSSSSTGTTAAPTPPTSSNSAGASGADASAGATSDTAGSATATTAAPGP